MRADALLIVASIAPWVIGTALAIYDEITQRRNGPSGLSSAHQLLQGGPALSGKLPLGGNDFQNHLTDAQGKMFTARSEDQVEKGKLLRGHQLVPFIASPKNGHLFQMGQDCIGLFRNDARDPHGEAKHVNCVKAGMGLLHDASQAKTPVLINLQSKGARP